MTEIRSTEYFAIVPEWVIHADISANAVRLYAVLNRFANSHGHAWPSRKTIADLMRVSVATVDRAKEELVEINALTVKPRTTPSGDPSSNLYILHTSQNGPPSSVRQGTPTDDETGMVARDALKRDSMKQRKEHSLACKTCLGKYRVGYDDGTEGLSHIAVSTNDTQSERIYPAGAITYIVCTTCQGSGKDLTR